jgi:hypothetical protein
MFYKCIRDQHGGGDKPGTNLSFPVVVYFFLLLGVLQLLGKGKTWFGHGSFPLLEKADILCSKHQIVIQVRESGVHLECHGLNLMYFVVISIHTLL